MALPISVVVAAIVEFLLAEPPRRVHPVAWFGRVVAVVDRDWSDDGRRSNVVPLAVGTVTALVLPIGFAAAAWLAVAGPPAVLDRAGLSGPVVRSSITVVLAGLALFVTTSYRMLLTEAEGVVLATEGDPEAARERLPALAGRDPSGLSPGQLRSAAVESAAENLADGLVAPLLAFSVLAPVSPAMGAAGAAWVKGVNTLDSMLGYRSKVVGTPAARLDDLVMWLPARVSAVLVSLAAASPDPILRARRWADVPSSPNAGWPMGTLAAAVGVRLHKPGAYDLQPTAPLPDVATARRGLRVVGRAGLLAYCCAALVEVVAWL